MKSKSLAQRLMILILTSTTAIFVAAFSYNYHSSKETVMRNVEEKAKYLTFSTIHKIETVLRAVEKIPHGMASVIEAHPFESEGIMRLVEDAVSSNPELFGSAIAYEPYGMDPGRLYFAPYCHRGAGGKVVSTFLGNDSYHYFFMDWYQIPKELDSAAWTEPYFDEGGGNIVMVTYSVPFAAKVDNKKKFRGVVTGDISLAWLKDIVSSVKIYETGYAFLLSHNGVFITYPDARFIMRDSIFSVAQAKGDEKLRKLGQDMLRGGEGFVPLNDFAFEKKSWMYYAPLPSIGWSLGVIVPEDELFADVRRLSMLIVSIGFIGFIFLFFTIALISGTITRPLRLLDMTTHEIALGNLDVELPPVATQDEIGRLADSFGKMKVALKEYIVNLAETTAAKERIESELKIARTIQMSFLPKRFPPFPGKETFEIYATLESARHVGGDLYDFFLLDEDHLIFLVGDVSDKGVPAALFMAVTKTLLKGIAEPGMEPSEILNRVNVELSRDNESMMFVTVFCGILDVNTGELVYSNAGHEPPVLIRRNESPQWLPIPKGFLLGAMAKSRYETDRVRLEEGDMLLVYTDGVTEAMDVEKSLYTNVRLLETVRENQVESAQRLVEITMDSIKEHSKGAAQSDDITVLALRFKGKPEKG